MNRSITIGGINLNSIPEFKATKILPYELPAKDIEMVDLALADGSRVIDTRYGNRKLIIEGYFKQCNRQAFDIVRDRFLGVTESRQPLSFVFEQGGADRLYRGIVSNTGFSYDGGSIATVSLEVLCNVPFGEDITDVIIFDDDIDNTITQQWSEAVLIGGNTYANMQISLDVLGVGANQLEDIIITARMADEVRIMNIPSTWAVGNNLRIDSNTVRVNGQKIAYSGRFPAAKGSTNLIIDMPTTITDYHLKITYKRRWL